MKPVRRMKRPLCQRPTKGRRHPKDQLQGSLRRLPSDFCWQLLDRLLTHCSEHLSSEIVRIIRDVIRRRDTVSYYALDAQMGLQCLSRWADPMPGNPAVVHMLCSVFRKCENLELLDRKARRDACLLKVREIDDSIPSFREEWESDEVYQIARRWIQTVLGSAPTTEAITYSAKHGPGSTASTPFQARSTYFKYAAWPYRTTPSARNLLVDCLTTDERWLAVLEDSLRREYEVPMWSILDRGRFLDALVDGAHPYNVITTVPKDGRKDRPIAKEQLGNIYLQLGIGSIIRGRLRLRGVDLDTQALRNREMALVASRDQSLFTIDLSSASDTIGTDLVRALLPADWFCLLDSLRAPWGVLPSGEAFLYRKFSSMGNGFTFELESLIFLSLAVGIRAKYGAGKGPIAAFGDDIIGPDYLYPHFRRYLEYSGFRVNSEKSFHGRARVRESCGFDCLDGVNIRPVFIKRTPASVMEAIGLRNRVRAWFLRMLGSYPVQLDEFLLGMFDELPPVGPDSSEEYDGWLQDGSWAYGRRFYALVPTATQLPARELGFRKLMHSLRSCTSDGGNFIVSEQGARTRLVGRIVNSQFDWLLNN